MILIVQSSIFLTQLGSQLLFSIDVDRNMHRPTFKIHMTTLRNSFRNIISGSHFLVTFEIKTIRVKNSRSQVNVILRKESEEDTTLAKSKPLRICGCCLGP